MLDAATAILEEDGYAGFTLAAVGKRAGVAMSSIYRRVDSKEFLFDLVQERVLAHVVPVVEQAAADVERWDRLAPEELVRELVRFFAGQMEEDRRFLKVAVLRASQDDRVFVRSQGAARAYSAAFRRVLLTHLPPPQSADAEVAADVCFRIMWAMLINRISWGGSFESSIELPWEEFVEEVSNACWGYLCVVAPDGG